MSADRPPTPDQVFPTPLSSDEVIFLNDNAPFFRLINPGQLTDEQITVLREVRRDAGLAVNKKDQSPEELAASNSHATMVNRFVGLLKQSNWYLPPEVPGAKLERSDILVELGRIATLLQITVTDNIEDTKREIIKEMQLQGIGFQGCINQLNGNSSSINQLLSGLLWAKIAKVTNEYIESFVKCKQMLECQKIDLANSGDSKIEQGFVDQLPLFKPTKRFDADFEVLNPDDIVIQPGKVTDDILKCQKITEQMMEVIRGNAEILRKLR